MHSLTMDCDTLKWKKVAVVAPVKSEEAEIVL